MIFFLTEEANKKMLCLIIVEHYEHDILENIGLFAIS